MNKFMKYPALVVLLLLVAVVVAACDTGGGGGGTSNTPEGAAKAWFEAALSGNLDGVKAQTCAAGQESVETAAAAFGSLGASGATVDASGLTYTKDSETGDDATVTVGGTVKVTAAGQEVEQPMEPVPMPLRKESGAWKVCGF
jgi:hypothetical protein